ncbi:DUF2877 domain-containing protein [Mammaliicoccus lentus]|uniref:DUF2877 domain-containing protein n=1 Tax=Mammaliicoccus lentus TaxID=42858 RepID=UPI001B34278A|nr:DUF2877 domain-containing protein [Mammaliicoccus lentus]
MILNASATGSVALDLLRKHDAFYVHSIFKKGFNIITNQQDLIFIGTDENGWFPFGILVDSYTRDQLISEIEIGAQLKVQHHTLNINHLKLNWKVDVLDLEQDFDQCNVPLLKEQLDKFSFADYEELEFTSSKIDEFLVALSSKEVDIEPYLRYYIGRGQGLTPTGDDIITGILYANKLTPFIETSNLLKLKQLLNEHLTTVVSEAFLNCALDGLFSSKITKLQHEASEKAIKELISVGSSSGMDTLYGISLALHKEWN